MTGPNGSAGRRSRRAVDYQAMHLEKNLDETPIANIRASGLPRWQRHER
jgi:hypothetical protein